MHISFSEKKLWQFWQKSEIIWEEIIQKRWKKYELTFIGHWFKGSQQVVYTNTRWNSADSPTRQGLCCWLQQPLLTHPNHLCLSSVTWFTAQTIPSSPHPGVCANTTSGSADWVEHGNVTFLQAYTATEEVLPLNYSLGELDWTSCSI